MMLSAVAATPAQESESRPAPLEIRALHFYPPGSAQARRLTLAMALAGRRSPNDPGAAETWLAEVVAERRRLEDLAKLSPVGEAGGVDGRFADLVRAIEVMEPVRVPDMDGRAMLDWLMRPRQAGLDAAVAARWQAGAHLRLDAVWRAGITETGDAEVLLELWQPLLADAALWPDRAGSGAPAETGPPDLRGQALDLARRAEAVAVAAGDERGRARLELAMARTETAFARERVLDGLWHAFDAILAGIGQPRAVIDANLPERLNNLTLEYRDDLLAVDPVLVGVLAQLADAAAELAAEGGADAVAVSLADAYAQLALFITDIGFYLDQPVRQDIRVTIADCREALRQETPVVRSRFESCLESLLSLTGETVRGSELTGEAGGPFAAEYLRRETGLVAAQRMDYLLGYVDWELGGGCAAPGWFNVLEWSLGAAVVEWWADHRRAFFTAPRWQEALSTARRGGEEFARDLVMHLDCLTGQGAQRRDPVERLLDTLADEIDNLSGHLETARADYRQQVLAPGSDIRLDGNPELSTRYRPENLAVESCDPERTCGMTVRLPVSRALLGLFPGSYLAADQTGMGRLELCYDRVEWVDRVARPARPRDPSVADYHGRLAFELVGRFRPDSGPAGEVFRKRLVSESTSHYLFAAAGDELLARPCPRDVVGKPVESRLPEGEFHLVPDRLTYYAASPTTPSKVVLANWDQGAEWRDRFVTGRGIEVLADDDGQGIAPAVTARIRELGAGLQRELAGRMLRPPLMNDTDPLTLSMTRIAGLKDLLRRLLELAYPGLLRHGDGYRAAFTGDTALPDRDLVRRMRAEQQPMAGLPDRAHDRIGAFRHLWRRLPEIYRESGQVPPELIRGLLGLFALESPPAVTVNGDDEVRP